MLILYKNAARANYFTDLTLHCFGGSPSHATNEQVFPFGYGDAEVACTAKLREFSNQGVGKEIEAELYIRGDRGEIPYRKDISFMLPSTASTLDIQVCTKEKSETIKSSFCLCFSSRGVIVAQSEPMCILSKPPGFHKLPFARISEGKSQCSSPSRWISGYSADTHTYTPLAPTQLVKVWRTKQESITNWTELSEENVRLKKRLKLMETEREGLVEALRLLKH